MHIIELIQELITAVFFTKIPNRHLASYFCLIHITHCNINSVYKETYIKIYKGSILQLWVC